MRKILSLIVISLILCLQYALTQNIVFPSAAEGYGYVDVTRAPYNAPNDGVGIATSAINAAIKANIGSGKSIYFPNGTYLVDSTIFFPDMAGGALPRNLTLQGQSQAGVIIKLKDNCTGFTNPDSPKAIVVTGHDVAQCFFNCVKNMTINSGTGNSGAIGMRFYANNTGRCSEVSIISEDGNGIIGLDLNYQNENGPLFVKNVTIDGFNIGINSGQCQNSQTIEHITIKNQKQYGILHASGVLSIRDLKSKNSVQVVKNSGVLTILGANLSGVSSSAAMSNNGILYVRDFSAAGYSKGIDNTAGNGQNLAGLTTAEWNSHDETHLNAGVPGMLKLQIKETPEMIWDDESQWQVVDHPGDGTDASDAIQAAIDAGKTTVYFNSGNYKVKKLVYIRGNVRTLYGFGANLDITSKGSLVVHEGTSPTVVFENFQGGYSNAFFVTHSSTRTVALKDIVNWGVKKEFGSGDLFLEDICANPWTKFEFYGGNVWARQLNPECRDFTKILSSATNLWILGLKTEWGAGGGTLINTRDGGKTEVCGFLCYNVTSPGTLPMFINSESAFSAIGIENAWNPTVEYTTFIQETILGVTKTLATSVMPGNCSGSGNSLPYYVSNALGDNATGGVIQIKTIK